MTHHQSPADAADTTSSTDALPQTPHRDRQGRIADAVTDFVARAQAAVRRMRERWKGKSGWLPVLVLVVFAVLGLSFGRHHGLSDEIIGGLAGSFIGAAPILSGVLFDRHQRRADELELRAERRAKLKTLIADELANVAAGQIGAKSFLDSLVKAANLGHPGPRGDLSRHLPRPMPITSALGVELLSLSQREISMLVTLRANLTTTETSMREAMKSRTALDLLTAKKIQRGIRHDIGLLAEAFSEFAPGRKLALDGKEPELTSVVLARLSGHDDEP